MKYCILVLGLLSSVQAADRLQLLQAEQIALEKDPLVQAQLKQAEALAAKAMADAQLPDPQFKTGLYNTPLDDFDLRREPSTQLRFGIQQRFPRGLEYRAQQSQALSLSKQRQAAWQRQRILRSVRLEFLEIYYQEQAAAIIQASRPLFVNLKAITEVQYGSGMASQQDVLRAELELSKLDDRLTAIKNQEEQARARLSQWIGELAWWPLPKQEPQLPDLPSLAQIEQSLGQHPEILYQNALIEQAEAGVRYAREQYKPGWAVGAEYRLRFGDNPDDSDRSDMMAVMLTVDLPVFTAKRQDQRLLSSQKQADAAYLKRDDRLRQLKKTLAVLQSNQKRLQQRINHYQKRLIAEAQANAQAALQAYQSGTIEFINLMRAQITVLDVQLQALKLKTDWLKNQAKLLYLAAGVSS